MVVNGQIAKICLHKSIEHENLTALPKAIWTTKMNFTWGGSFLIDSGIRMHVVHSSGLRYGTQHPVFSASLRAFSCQLVAAAAVFKCRVRGPGREAVK